jgi:hypothetical protein
VGVPDVVWPAAACPVVGEEPAGYEVPYSDAKAEPVPAAVALEAADAIVGLADANADKAVRSSRASNWRYPRFRL